jgi:pre-mRNA-splicing helicase BRR2
LQTTESERDLEQDLLTLVDYDKFSLVKQLIRNRATIVWCTRLARAENADVEKRIEVKWQYACEDALLEFTMHS